MYLGRRLATLGISAVLATAGITVATVLPASAHNATRPVAVQFQQPTLNTSAQCDSWPKASGTVTLSATNKNKGPMTLKVSVAGQDKRLYVAGHKTNNVSFALKSGTFWAHVTGYKVDAWRLVNLNCPVRYNLKLTAWGGGITTDCKGHTTTWVAVNVRSEKIGYVWVNLAGQSKLVKATPWGTTVYFFVPNKHWYRASVSGQGYNSAFSAYVWLNYAAKVPPACKKAG